MAADTESLIEYPCDFPIKVMGPNDPGFVDAMCFLARQFDPDWQEASLERRESKGGKYLGLTLTLHATIGLQRAGRLRAMFVGDAGVHRAP
jgi:putative lipoic acid-binding regulatory protein